MATQVREVENVIAALNGVVQPEMIAGTLSALTPERIRQFNGLVLRGLELEEGVVAGEVRTYSVGVMRYRGAPAIDCEHLLQRDSWRSRSWPPRASLKSPATS